MIMPGWQDYALSLDRMCSSVWGGADPEDGAGNSRRRVGCRRPTAWARTSQKAFYEEYKKLPGSSADNTVEKLGMAVKLD
ncbi:hypothetical protein [Aestuariivirga sp.]|uniref:hypothetical protein n=1 Tax=Aestuariivirga sp. TaxID=2650926 RepID=UPI0039E25022